jgi:hypothetical protein
LEISIRSLLGFGIRSDQVRQASVVSAWASVFRVCVEPLKNLISLVKV